MTTTWIQCDRCGEVDAGAERGQKFCKFCLDLSRPPSQPGREVPNDDEVEKAILEFARDHSRVFPLTYESGPYEITKATSRAMDFARAILALTSGTDPGAVTGEPVYCTRDGADFCNAVSDKARCSICPAFPSRNSTDE